ncbi:complement C1q tumor necrosis factor-related protein 4-like [Anneissia japonica]|uniref:complement C1q tumor necrosis factor-related protein 4-like n=1 Tax=Anneissia japonica TaxID=1529436 RepID=UPI0014258825|nr:complement C1q tumor necrosis factor-related protein 4-like [Anneissia japonica]
MALFIGALLAVVILVVAGDCKPKYDLTESAFTAKMTRRIDASPTKNTPIVFDLLLTNIGNDYNAKNGKFTTRIAGTYVFSLSLMSKSSPSKIAFGCLQKNGKEQLCVWSNGNNTKEMSSNMITINLKKGDVVDNVLKAGNNYALNNYGQAGYCSFTGFLLYPEVSVLEKLFKTIDTLSK